MNEDNNKLYLWSALFVSLVGIITIILLIIKTEIQSSTMVFISGGFLMVVLLLFFGNKLVRKFTNDKDGLLKVNEKVYAVEELRKIAEKMVLNNYHLNHVKKWNYDYQKTIGEQSKKVVQIFRVELEYGNKNDEVYLILNTTRPKNLNSVLINPGTYLLTSTINSIGENTEEKLDVKEIEVENILTGTKTKTKEITHKDNIKDPKKVEEGKKEEVA